MTCFCFILRSTKHFKFINVICCKKYFHQGNVFLHSNLYIYIKSNVLKCNTELKFLHTILTSPQSRKYIFNIVNSITHKLAFKKITVVTQRIISSLLLNSHFFYQMYLLPCSYTCNSNFHFLTLYRIFFFENETSKR